MADHGINVSRADTAVATPNTATCGIPFVIGTAPLSKATGTPATAGLPVLCTSYDEAKEQLGYDDDWAKYTVCAITSSCAPASRSFSCPLARLPRLPMWPPPLSRSSCA
jgi:hypothetical protein